MHNGKALEMLEQGLIEELKEALRDEIYQDELKKKPGAKQRYSAMKKYFGYVKTSRAICMKPAKIEFDGFEMTSFCNSYSLALTKESIGEIGLFTDDDGTYPNVGRMIKRDGSPVEVDLNEIIASAKSHGYKLTKSEVNGETFVVRYKGTFYRLGLIDATYSIINDGKKVVVYHSGDKFSPLTIENDIGVCLILPVKRDDEFCEVNEITIIELI
jgi:hypothetical protein